MKNGHHYAAPIAFGFTTSQPMELPAFKLGVVSSHLSCWLFQTSAQRSWSSLRILRISIAVDDVLDGPPTFAQFLSCCGHKLLLSLRLLSHPRRLKNNIYCNHGTHGSAPKLETLNLQPDSDGQKLLGQIGSDIKN